MYKHQLFPNQSSRADEEIFGRVILVPGFLHVIMSGDVLLGWRLGGGKETVWSSCDESTQRFVAVGVELALVNDLQIKTKVGVTQTQVTFNQMYKRRTVVCTLQLPYADFLFAPQFTVLLMQYNLVKTLKIRISSIAYHCTSSRAAKPNNQCCKQTKVELNSN